MPDEVSEIKTRLDIVDLVSEYVRLKQMGTNWKGLCPFHNEKTPSFMASRDKQIWHCFGCNEGGDVFSFIQKIEGLDFPGALRLLAQKAGVTLEPRNPKLASQRNRLLEATQYAVGYYRKVLEHEKLGAKARAYLEQRGVGQATIDLFQIGYSLDSWDGLLSYMKSKGFTEQELFLAGLVVKKERGVGYYDRFRDRLMFPINNVHGNPVGFSGRTLKADESAKYINTPQTDIYNKSAVVFNLDRAKNEIRKLGMGILVEGQMDVVSSVQAGVPNVVAVSGTALTGEQVRLLKRFTSTLAIALDFDAAGQQAVDRSTEVIQLVDPGGEEVTMKIITIPNGKDPDECIRHNPDDWRAAVAAAQPVMDYYFDRARRQFDLKSAVGKKTAAKLLLAMIQRLVNPVEQAHWIGQLAELLAVPETALWETIRKSPKPPVAMGAKPAAAPMASVSRAERLAEQALGLLIAHPRELPRAVDLLPAEIFPEGELQQLYKSLLVYYTKNISEEVDSFDFDQFRATLPNERLQAVANKLVLQTEKDFFDFPGEDIPKEIGLLSESLKRDYYSGELTRISDALQQAEQAGNQADISNLTERFEEVANLKRLVD